MASSRLLLEVLWFGFAAFVGALATLPAYLGAGGSPYLWPTFALTFAGVTLLRLVFFHRESPWLRHLAVKALLCVAMLPLIVYAVLTLNEVQTFVDANGFEAAFLDAPTAVAEPWGRYLRNAVLLSSAATTLAAVTLPVALIITAWRQVKAGEYTF